ncbi:LiaI-LiaF-like domain-containing protein [Bacteroidota bacterium]
MSAETNKRVLLAGILILIGFVFILKSFGLIPPFFWWIFSWEMILIVVGLFVLLARGAVLPGVILIGVGSYFLLQDIGFYWIDHWMIWAIILIAVGMVILLKREIPGEKRHRKWEGGDHFGHKETTDPGMDYIDEVAAFGGGEKIITSQNFKGGRVTGIFGGTEINFLNAKLATGTNYLDIFYLFGGTTLIIPKDWNVKTDIVALFGGIGDKRDIVDNPDNDDKVLYIKGFVLFGGGEIKSFK